MKVSSFAEPLYLIPACRMASMAYLKLGALKLYEDRLVFFTTFEGTPDLEMDFTVPIHAMESMEIPILVDRIATVQARKPGFITRLRFGGEHKQYDLKFAKKGANSLLIPEKRSTVFETWVHQRGIVVRGMTST